MGVFPLQNYFQRSSYQLCFIVWKASYAEIIKLVSYSGFGVAGKLEN